MGGNVISKIVGFILAAILMFGVPMMFNFQRMDDISQTVVTSKTAQFVDSVRQLGYVTKTMYHQFNRELTKTMNVYSVEMEHYHKRYEPVYTDGGVFTGEYEVFDTYIHNDDIVKKVEENGIYYFSQDDLFNVKVHNINKTSATVLEDIVYKRSARNEKIVTEYGGMVRNESN